MTSKTLIKIIDEILAQFELEESLELLLVHLKDFRGILNKSILDLALANRGNDEAKAIDAMLDSFTTAKTVVMEASPRLVFRSIDKLDSLSDAIATTLPYARRLDQPPSYFHEVSHEFSTTYEKFIADRNNGTFIDLIFTGEKLAGAISSYKSSLSAVRAALMTRFPAMEGDVQFLSIYLERELDLSTFSEKLRALSGIYEEFCQIFEVSTAREPLKVVKVESGSLWVEILGSAVVVAFMRDMIVAGIGYLYRNYTKEGRIKQIPKTLEAAEEIFKFTDKLKERGIDVRGAEEAAKKVVLQSIEQLNVLVANEEVVEVDGVAHPITPDAQQKLLQDRTILSLNDRSSPSDSDFG